MWSREEVARVVELAREQLGKPYEFGAKPKLDDPRPETFDCAGFVRWVIGQGRDDRGRQIILPEGSFEQIKVCKALARPPRPLDLGFADLHPPAGVMDHVVMKIDDENVIEARGKPYNGVILRPIAKWEAQKGFMGWWEVPGVNS